VRETRKLEIITKMFIIGDLFAVFRWADIVVCGDGVIEDGGSTGNSENKFIQSA
jgi:hypothetical protein